MVKVKNLAAGIYADGVLFLQSGEVAEVPEEKARYLCSAECPGQFERVDEKPAAQVKAAVVTKKGKD